MPVKAKARCSVWYVDDDTPTASDIINYWKAICKSGRLPKPCSIEFRHFSTGQAAWAAFQTEGAAPQIVVIDGHLDADEGTFKDGASLVRRVRSVPLPIQPVLIAFSGDEFALQDMERSGASVGFDKGSFRPVIEYIADKVIADSKVCRRLTEQAP